MTIAKNLINIKSKLPKQVSLVAVSKTKPITDIKEAYETGQRIFGENKIQELAEKYEHLPKDIKWHMIGHVQTNKVKYIAEFVDLIHGVDSFKLLKEINRQALKHNRIINCLLQIKIAKEESKFGISKEDASTLLHSEEFEALNNIKVVGLMGMATFTNDQSQVENEFSTLKSTFDELKSYKTKSIDLKVLSMGMSGDYELAIQCGSNMIRVGSSIFGARNYNN